MPGPVSYNHRDSQKNAGPGFPRAPRKVGGDRDQRPITLDHSDKARPRSDLRTMLRLSEGSVNSALRNSSKVRPRLNLGGVQ